MTHLDTHGIIIVQRTYILYSNRSATNRYSWDAKNVEWEKGEDTMTYTASDIAKYIVSYCFRKRKPVSNLKLQKMLYYMWIEYYKKTKKSLFNDDICAWQFGPVIPDIYYAFCAYAGRPITKEYWIALDDDDREKIDKIIEEYLPIPVSTLVDRTHEEGMPWDLVYRNGLGARNVIPRYLIKSKECA